MAPAGDGTIEIPETGNAVRGERKRIGEHEQRKKKKVNCRGIKLVPVKQGTALYTNGITPAA